MARKTKSTKILKAFFHLLVLLMGGCSVFQPHVDSELVPYVASFERLHSVTSHVDIRFGQTPFPWSVGYCSLGYAGSRHVVLSEAFWLHATEMQRQHLVEHELGHCVLGLPHTEDRSSVMFPSM